MQFTFKARDSKGEISEGSLEAADRFIAAKELREQGKVPILITEVSSSAGGFSAKFEKFFAKVKLHEKIILIHNLAGMLSAGLPLNRALEVQKKQNKNPLILEIIDGLLETINAGSTLSEGFAKYPKVFPPLVVSMIRAGEESGNLSTTLNDIGSNLQKSYDLNRKIKSAMMYPMIIVFAVVLIGILMLIFVVPTLTAVFKGFGTKLPASTQFIITISDFATHHTFLFLGSVALIFGGGAIFVKAKAMQKTNETILLHLPVIGTIAKEVNTARTARTLSSLLLSGVEMTRALTITEDVLQNSYYKEVLKKANVAIQKGSTLSSIFKAETKLYPVMMGEMIAVGEETGSLTKMLADIAIYYESEVDAKTKDLSTIIEPMLMLFIGGAVGFFAISIISPMYGLVDSLSAG